MPGIRAATVLFPLLAVGALAALGGCSAEPRGSPSARILPTPTAAAVALPTIDIEQPGLTPGTGQTDTAWGPIWNGVPPEFPPPPGSQPAEAGPGTGPVSGAWTVPVGGLPNAGAVAQFYVDEFARVGYGGSRDGPLEDGSHTAWASNGYGCDILVTAAPRGSDETLATVLYGAGCPFSWPVE